MQQLNREDNNPNMIIGDINEMINDELNTESKYSMEDAKNIIRKLQEQKLNSMVNKVIAKKKMADKKKEKNRKRRKLFGK